MLILYACFLGIMIKSCLSNNNQLQHEGESSHKAGVDIAPYAAEIDNATQSFVNDTLQDLETKRKQTYNARMMKLLKKLRMHIKRLKN